MTIELDHIFVLTTPGANEADALVKAGFIEGSTNTHPGQGTANRRFFFENIKLEFLYVHDIAEAMNGPAKGLRFVERAIDVSGSPFGLVTRVIPGVEVPNFPAWKYFPEYFPDDMCFYVGDNAKTFDEPLCICMPPALEARANSEPAINEAWTLTNCQLSVPGGKPSGTLSAFSHCDGLSVRYGEAHRLVLTFNDGKQGESLSLQPELPVELIW